MNHGPLIFFGVFASMIASWWALILTPHLQIGSQQAKATDAGIYPAQRPGIAEQGKQVYVAAGCVYCHSQQVHQEGFTFDVLLAGAGTNQAEVLKWIEQHKTGLGANPQRLLDASDASPVELLRGVPRHEAQTVQSQLTDLGAKAQIVFVPLGADMRRGWGGRRSVAQDYLYEYPVQVGNSRLGPDLANIGMRNPDPKWHLRHLYNPRSEVKGSMMPAYQYLFEKRKTGRQASPDALALSGELAPPAGYEIVPRPEALRLVAYLQSLRVDAPLFEAPMTQAPRPAAPADTNAPAATATNAPATNTPAK